MSVVGRRPRESVGGVTLVFSQPAATEEPSVVIRGHEMPRGASSSTTPGRRPVAVTFCERDRSPASGLRFGWVEVLVDAAEPLVRGYMPEAGARAVARILGVPLRFVSP